MKAREIVDQFVVMRGAGMTYREISIEIDVSEKTLKQWGNKYASEIKQAEDKGLAVAIEAFNMAKADRLKAISDQVKAIDKELKKRDLSSVPVGRLIGLKLSALVSAGRIIGGDDAEISDRDMQSPWEVLQKYVDSQGDEKVTEELPVE